MSRPVHPVHTFGMHPTKTRLALLSDVRSGEVARDSWPQGHDAADRVTAAGLRDVNLVTGRTVTAAVTELEKAGWVTLAEQGWATGRRVNGQPVTRRFWALTPAGLAVEDGTSRTSGGRA